MTEQISLTFSTKTYLTILGVSVLISFIGFCYSQGFRLFAIASGSMEPAITIGSLVITQPDNQYYPGRVISYYKTVEPDLLKNTELKAHNPLLRPIVSWAVGSDKSYRDQHQSKLSYKNANLLQEYSNNSSAPQVITHRVIGLAKRGGVVHYRTKGDANLRPDQELVSPAQVIGRVWLNIPLLGYVLLLPHYKLGFFVIVLVPAIWIILDQILKIIILARLSQP